MHLPSFIGAQLKIFVSQTIYTTFLNQNVRLMSTFAIIKLSVINLTYLRNEETVGECIKAVNVLSFWNTEIAAVVVQMETRFEDFKNFQFVELVRWKEIKKVPFTKC